MPLFPKKCDLYVEVNTEKFVGTSSFFSKAKDIVFVTEKKNVSKAEEVWLMFMTHYKGNVPFNLIIKDIDLPDLQGEPDEVYKKKGQAAFDLIKGPCIVEYTSLGFNATNGMSGIYTKLFLEKLGPQDLHRMLMEFKDNSALAISTFAFINKKGEVNLFKGELTGTIVPPICTDTTVPDTFGWESYFKPDGYEVTYAEMSRELKDLICPRIMATLKLKEFFDKN